MNERTRKQSLVAEVNGVVSPKSYRYQELGIQDSGIPFFNIGDSHRVHVMDVDGVMNVVTFDTHVTSVVPDDDVVSNVPPLSRRVEALVHPAVEPKGCFTDLSTKSEVLEAFLKALDPFEFGVRPILHGAVRRDKPRPIHRSDTTAWLRLPVLSALPCEPETRAIRSWRVEA